MKNARALALSVTAAATVQFSAAAVAFHQSDFQIDVWSNGSVIAYNDSFFPVAGFPTDLTFSLRARIGFNDATLPFRESGDVEFQGALDYLETSFSFNNVDWYQVSGEAESSALFISAFTNPGGADHGATAGLNARIMDGPNTMASVPAEQLGGSLSDAPFMVEWDFFLASLFVDVIPGPAPDEGAPIRIRSEADYLESAFQFAPGSIQDRFFIVDFANIREATPEATGGARSVNSAVFDPAEIAFFSLEGEITNIAIIPIPAALVMLASGLGLLGIRGALVNRGRSRQAPA